MTNNKDIKENIFGERLRELLFLRKIKVKTLAEDVNLSYKTISAYINGYSQPSVKQVIAISKILNCSADYLLGLCDEPRPLSPETDEIGKEIYMIRKSFSSMTEKQRNSLIALVNSITE